MLVSGTTEDRKTNEYKSFTRKDLDRLGEFMNIPQDIINQVKIASLVIPFRTNEYVINELINWEQIPNDPIFILNFPLREMLHYNHYSKLQKAVEEGSSKNELKSILNQIHNQLNPHPAGQINYNTPVLNNKELKGIQHKYRETVLCFPSEGQMCHAFCTFCFRWAQFIGNKELKFSLNNPQDLVEYVQNNEESQEILFTGGDPMVMRSCKLTKYIRPLLEANIKHLKAIRIGTKSLTYWPYRFISDSDTDNVLELFKEINQAGKHLTIISHINHPVELSTHQFKDAVRNIQSTGAVIRTQSPILNHINAESEIWQELIRKQVDLGLVPYYMFVPRNTGPKEYFDVSLVEAFRIYNRTIRKLSGLCRTIRGPVMSTTPGKVQVIGITSINNQRVIGLKFIQARNPKWIGRIFFAEYDKEASWLTELQPAFTKKFFYEHELTKYLQPYHTQESEEIEDEFLIAAEITEET